MPDPILYTAFSKSTGGAASRALGAAIRAFTGGEVNHAFLLYFDPNLRCWMTRGANSNGVTELALEIFLKDREIVRIFRPHRARRQKLLERVLSAMVRAKRRDLRS